MKKIAYTFIRWTALVAPLLLLTGCKSVEEGFDFAPIAVVDNLDCGKARLVGTLTAGVEAIVLLKVPYAKSNGQDFAGETVPSTGVTGLTATLDPLKFKPSPDSLTYTITGTPATAGTAKFRLGAGRDSCDLSVPVYGCGAFIAPGIWKRFMCYNLGAFSITVDPFTPRWEIIGDYYQWGRRTRAADGPKGPSTAEANAGVLQNWNTTAASNGSWRDDIKTGNDPCDPGFRVPTRAQWEGVINHNVRSDVGSWVNSATNYATGMKFGPNLFLPAAGSRGYYYGELNVRGEYGSYWSSSERDSFSAWYLGFDRGLVSPADFSSRTFGLPVRCISE